MLVYICTFYIKIHLFEEKKTLQKMYIMLWFARLPHWHNDPSPVNLYKWYVPQKTGHAHTTMPLAAAEAFAVYLPCDWSAPALSLDAAASVRFTGLDQPKHLPVSAV